MHRDDADGFGGVEWMFQRNPQRRFAPVQQISARIHCCGGDSVGGEHFGHKVHEVALAGGSHVEHGGGEGGEFSAVPADCFVPFGHAGAGVARTQRVGAVVAEFFEGAADEWAYCSLGGVVEPAV